MRVLSPVFPSLIRWILSTTLRVAKGAEGGGKEGGEEGGGNLGLLSYSSTVEQIVV